MARRVCAVICRLYHGQAVLRGAKSKVMRIRCAPLLLACGFVMASSAVFAQEESERKIDYLVLEGGGPDQGPGPDMEANMDSLLRVLGTPDPHASRMYAYGLQQIRLLSRSTAVIRDDINQALDAAERTGIPIWLHVDPFYAWGADTETREEDAPAVKFWNHPEMREWKEFPKDGNFPEYIPRLWFNWGPWCSPVSAVPAFGSPKFVEFVQSQLREGVLEPLKERLEIWKSDNREYLFAGINIGWEIYIPFYSEKWLRFSNRGSMELPKVEFPKHLAGLQMDEELLNSQLGYASLHWRGWTEEKLQKAAQEEGKSRDEKFQDICYEVMHDYMKALAKECVESGLTPDQVYTHIVALATVAETNTFHPPIWTAVNEYSTPGFTMDNYGAAKYDMDTLTREISEAPGSRGAAFGSVEAYFGLGDRNYVTDALTYKDELNELFASGARVNVIYAAFPYGRKPQKEAFIAVKDWLKEGDR